LKKRQFVRYKLIIDYFISNYKWSGLFIVIFLVLSSVFQVSTIGMILPIIDYIQVDGVVDYTKSYWPYIGGFFNLLSIPLSLISLLVTVFFMAVFYQVFFYTRNIFLELFRPRCELDLQHKIIGTLFFAPFKNVSEYSSSDLITKTLRLSSEVSFGYYRFFYIVALLVQAFAYIVFMCFISVKLTLIMGLSFSFMLVLSGVKLNKMKSLGSALNQSYLSYSRFIEERLRALKYIKVLNIEKESYHVIQKLLDQVYQLSRVRVFAKNNLDLLTQPLFYILLLGFIWISDTYFDLTIASIMVFLLLGTRLMPLLQSFNNEYSFFLTQIASAESIFQFIDQKIALNLQSKKRYNEEIDQLSVVDMSFHYTNNHVLFNCINYTFHKGKKYAILGQSGAGKTTLIDIILGLILPSDGLVIINQNNDLLKNYSLDAFYLPQIPIVIEGTVKENLSFTTSKEFSDEKMWQALDYVALKETFEERAGLDTHIEFDAKNISIGQKQRLALARLFLHDYKLIVLDEFTSAVDQESKAIIISAIKKIENCIMLFITHDNDVAAVADEVLTIKNQNLVKSDLKASPLS
jgi:ATP-binding cassette, subfamily B, bacterial PglK